MTALAQVLEALALEMPLQMPERIELPPDVASRVLEGEAMGFSVKGGARYRIPGVPVDFYVDDTVPIGSVRFFFRSPAPLASSTV